MAKQKKIWTKAEDQSGQINYVQMPIKTYKSIKDRKTTRIIRLYFFHPYVFKFKLNQLSSWWSAISTTNKISIIDFTVGSIIAVFGYYKN